MPLAPFRASSGPTATAERFTPDSYVTDGQRLFRVVSAYGEQRRFASLEDCLTLEVHAYAPGELGAMKLRSVNAMARR